MLPTGTLCPISDFFPSYQAARSRPDFTNTEPAVQIGPFPQWSDPRKIVSMDPWGHLAPWLFKDIIENENGAHWSCQRSMFPRH